MSLPAPFPPPPAHTRGNPVWRQRIRSAKDTVTIYLPVLLMAVLALASYGVLKDTPPPQAITAAPPQWQEPDYFMAGFSVKLFEADGRQRGVMTGRQLRHLPASAAYEAIDAQIRSVDHAGALTTASASRMHSNQAQTEFLLEGDVILVREAWGDRPRMEFRGERIHLNTDTGRAWSDLPVQVLRGGDAVIADRFSHTREPGVLDMHGRVRLQIQARKTP